MNEVSTPEAGEREPQLWSYRSGSWYAVFGPEVAVLLPAGQKEHVAALWALVDGGAGFDEVLDALLASGLSRLPGFVLVSTGAGPTRVLLRGAGVSARLSSAGGDATVDGTAGGTWTERTVEGVTALSVEVEDGDEGADLAIPAGLVRVARIDRPAAAAEPATPAEPLAEPLAEPATPAESVAEPVADAPSLIAPPPIDVPADAPADLPVDDAPETELIEAPPVDVPPAPEASPLDNEGWTEPTFAGDPLTDPLPTVDGTPEPPAVPESTGPITPDEPAGWVTPQDLPAPPVDAPGPPPIPAPAPPVPGFAPPPPADAASVPPPPLPVGSWEPAGGAPVGGAVAKLLISDGQTVLVEGVVLIGRAPEARRFTSTEQPQLITVPSRLHEISSTHVEVRPGTGADQGSAVVTDMGSTNGTVLVQPGIGPEDLKPGIAVRLVPGAIINLGDGVTIQVTRP